MMFILDEISCAAEEFGLSVVEKVDRLRYPLFRMDKGMPCNDEKNHETEREDEGTENGSVNEGHRVCKEDYSFDDYLLECAQNMLSLFAMQGNTGPENELTETKELMDEPEKEYLSEEQKEDLETAIRLAASKLSEDDKEEILEAIENQEMRAEFRELFGICEESGSGQAEQTGQSAE